MTINIIDIEASDLDGYPIQIGAVNTQKYKFSSYIKPCKEWIDSFKWTKAAEDIHNLSFNFIKENGKTANIVANDLNNFFKDEIVFVETDYDLKWLNMLYLSAGIKPSFEFYNLFDYHDHEYRIHWSMIYHIKLNESGLREHDALNDAIVLQATFEHISKFL